MQRLPSPEKLYRLFQMAAAAAQHGLSELKYHAEAEPLTANQFEAAKRLLLITKYATDIPNLTRGAASKRIDAIERIERWISNELTPKEKLPIRDTIKELRLLLQ